MLKAHAQEATTKDRIVDAALEVVKAKGFSGATARAIADRGGLNQALVFYHYGSVKALLLAALDATSAERLARYEEALAGTTSSSELVTIARTLYAEDVASGHTTVLAEMVAGGVNDPELGPAIARRIEPWVTLAEAAITRAVTGTPFEGLLPTRDLAFAVVSFYVGLELVGALEDDRSRAEELFGMIERFMPLIDPGSDRR